MDELKLAELLKSVIREEISGIKQDISTLKQVVSTLKQDVSTLKQVVSTLNQDVSTLKQVVSTLKSEIDEMKKEMATKVELMSMEQRFTNSIEKIREALKLSLLEIHDDLEEIKFKMKFYDFDFLLKQNDHLAGVLKDILEERKSLSQRMRDYEERLKLIEAR